MAQVSDSVKEGLFKPVRLMEMEREGEGELEGRVFLFGETRTQRKIL